MFLSYYIAMRVEYNVTIKVRKRGKGFMCIDRQTGCETETKQKAKRNKRPYREALCMALCVLLPLARKRLCQGQRPPFFRAQRA